MRWIFRFDSAVYGPRYKYLCHTLYILTSLAKTSCQAEIRTYHLPDDERMRNVFYDKKDW